MPTLLSILRKLFDDQFVIFRTTLRPADPQVIAALSEIRGDLRLIKAYLDIGPSVLNSTDQQLVDAELEAAQALKDQSAAIDTAPPKSAT